MIYAAVVAVNFNGLIMGNISIKRTLDFFSIITLNEQIFSKEEEIDLHTINYGWIARSCKNNEPIGFCVATDIGCGILFLSRSGLLPEFRGGGVQRRFIRIRERFARSNNFKMVITYVHPDNHSSFVSLIKSGYEIYEPVNAWVGEEYIYLRKRIK